MGLLRALDCSSVYQIVMARDAEYIQQYFTAGGDSEIPLNTFTAPRHAQKHRKY